MSQLFSVSCLGKKKLLHQLVLVLVVEHLTNKIGKQFLPILITLDFCLGTPWYRSWIRSVNFTTFATSLSALRLENCDQFSRTPPTD